MSTVIPNDERKLTRLPRNLTQWKAYLSPEPIPPDMNTKVARKEIYALALPTLAELILTALTGMVDTIMVSRIGTAAIASINLTSQPKLLLNACFVAFNAGATAMIARFKGSGDAQMANKTLHQCVFVTILVSIIVSIVGFFLAEDMMRFMGAIPGETLELSTQYLQIQMLGIGSMTLTTAFTAGLRAIGRTRISLYYHLGSNAVNIVFNYFLINGKCGFPRLEVAGAGIATVLGQITAMLIAAYVLFRGTDILKLTFKRLFVVDFDVIRRLLRIGLPAMGEQLVSRLGMILFTKVVASLGTNAVATHSICNSIQSLTFNINQAFGVAITTLVGQALGRKRLDEAKAMVRLTRQIGFVLAVVVGICLFLLRNPLMRCYTQDMELISAGMDILIMIALIQPMQSSQYIYNGALRGAGDTRSTMIVMFVGMLIVRPIFGYLFAYPLGLGLFGAWCAFALDQTTRSAASMYRYKLGKWMYMRI